MVRVFYAPKTNERNKTMQPDPLDTLDAMKSGQTSADIGGPDDCSGAHTRPKFYQNPSCVSRDTNVVVCLSPATSSAP